MAQFSSLIKKFSHTDWKKVSDVSSSQHRIFNNYLHFDVFQRSRFDIPRLLTHYSYSTKPIDSQSLESLLIRPFVENVHSRPHTKDHLRSVPTSKLTFEQWKRFTNGQLSTVSPDVYRSWIHHDATLLDPEFNNDYERCAAGIRAVLAYLPEFDNSLTDMEILERVQQMEAEGRFTRAISGDFATRVYWKDFANALVNLAGWILTGNLDEKTRMTPIAYSLLKAVGFTVDRFNVETESYSHVELAVNPQTGAPEPVRAAQRTDYTVDLRMTSDELRDTKMKATGFVANPYIVAAGTENKLQGYPDSMPSESSFLGQLAFQSLLLSLRNKTLYDVNHPIPMTLIHGSKVHQFVTFYPSDMLDHFIRGDSSHLPEDMRAIMHRVDYNGAAGLDLFREGDREKIFWDLHALAGHLAQPIQSRPQTDSFMREQSKFFPTAELPEGKEQESV